MLHGFIDLTTKTYESSGVTNALFLAFSFHSTVFLESDDS